MSDKEVDTIVTMVKAMFDSDVAEIFRYMYELDEEVVDEEIAKVLNMKLNDVRRALYRLSEQGLVSYRRIRDRTTGWYTYYWKVNKAQIPLIVKQRKKVTISKLKERLKFEEENEFYICLNCGSRYLFDEALENEFKCYRCGSSLVYYDNGAIVEALRKKIKALEEKLKKEEESKK